MSHISIRELERLTGINGSTIRNNVEMLNRHLPAMIEHLRKKSEIKK